MRNRRDRLVGFEYDEAAGVAHFSMYVPGTAGRDRKRATVRAASYDEAVRLWSEFRSRAAEGLRRPSPEAPTFREFITDYFAAIETSLAKKTARDYRCAIDRHLLPQLGAFRLSEITSGVLNRLGARLNAAGYAGATVNNYVNLATLLLGYAVEFDVIADLPLKKEIKKQKANKPCLELNAEERARFLAVERDSEGDLHGARAEFEVAPRVLVFWECVLWQLFERKLVGTHHGREQVYRYRSARFAEAGDHCLTPPL